MSVFNIVAVFLSCSSKQSWMISSVVYLGNLGNADFPEGRRSLKKGSCQIMEDV